MRHPAKRLAQRSDGADGSMLTRALGVGVAPLAVHACLGQPSR